MPGWSEEELRRVGDAEELLIAPVRRNGELRGQTTIWGQARIWAGGVEKDVALDDADPSVLDAVDAAYREKYGRRYASIVDTINDAEHRASTLRLVPRGEG